MPDAADPKAGKGDHPRKGGWALGFVGFCVVVLGSVAAGYFGGPYADKAIFSDESSRKEGAALLSDVRKCLGEIEERKTQEVTRLACLAAPRATSGEIGPPVSPFAEWNRLVGYETDLHSFLEELRVAEARGYPRDVVNTLSGVIRRKLKVIEQTKGK